MYGSVSTEPDESARVEIRRTGIHPDLPVLRDADTVLSLLFGRWKTFSAKIKNKTKQALESEFGKDGKSL